MNSMPPPSLISQHMITLFGIMEFITYMRYIQTRTETWDISYYVSMEKLHNVSIVILSEILLIG